MQHGRGNAVYLLHGPPGAEADLWWRISVLSDGNDFQAPLGIDLDGDGKPDVSVRHAGSSGELDAGDVLQPFQVGPHAQVEFPDSSEHRLLLAGNRPFSLHADARVSRELGDGRAKLERISQQVRVVSSGGLGRGDYDFSIAPTPLQGLFAGPVKVLQFHEATRQHLASRLNEQGVEAIISYSMDRLDLSSGPGGIQLEVEYRIFR